MTSVNERQVGGDHYRAEYQHWDFVCDTHMHYLLGCATKYIARWRKKNGIQDLEKAKHYLGKADSKQVHFMRTQKNNERFIRFVNANCEGGEKSPECLILLAVYNCEYDLAIKRINELIAMNDGSINGCPPSQA